MQAAAPFYADAEPAHDWQHICRVLAYALKIGPATKADMDVVTAAVLLHDCVKLKPQMGQKDMSASESSQKAAEILKNVPEFPQEKIPAVQTCVREHSFKAGMAPSSTESEVLQDADRLESTGVVALMRVFAYCGAWKGKLFSWEDTFCDAGRGCEDKSIGLDWIFARLLKVSATLHTDMAKEIARQHDEHLRVFVEMARAEITGFPTPQMLSWEKLGPQKNR